VRYQRFVTVATNLYVHVGHCGHNLVISAVSGVLRLTQMSCSVADRLTKDVGQMSQWVNSMKCYS